MVDNRVDWYCPQKIYIYIYVMETSSRMLWGLPVSKIANLSWWGLLSQSYYHIMICFQGFSSQGLVKVIKRPMIWMILTHHQGSWQFQKRMYTSLQGYQAKYLELPSRATVLGIMASSLRWPLQWQLVTIRREPKGYPPNEPGRIHSGLWFLPILGWFPLPAPSWLPSFRELKTEHVQILFHPWLKARSPQDRLGCKWIPKREFIVIQVPSGKLS